MNIKKIIKIIIYIIGNAIIGACVFFWILTFISCLLYGGIIYYEIDIILVIFELNLCIFALIFFYWQVIHYRYD